MIPIKLSLTNFMSYREKVPPLYFEGIHTACISGDNGNGKSSLIDAMTWALWGKARAASDSLVNLAASEMAVEFEFAVGPQTYRILRRYAKPKRPGGQGKTVLEFQIAADGAFRAITGNTVSETQQQITDILHMDYNTFVNSALLLQGRADSFTIKPPVERKQVLADILGLAYYDRLEERAKEQARRQEVEKLRLEGTITDIDREMGQQTTCEADLEESQKQLEAVTKETAAAESRAGELRWDKDGLEAKKAARDQVSAQLERMAKDLARWEAQAKEHQSRLEEYGALLARGASIEEGFARYLASREQCREVDARLRQLNSLNTRRHQLEMAVAQASQSLVQAHAVAESRIAELEDSLTELTPLRQDLAGVRTQLGELGKQLAGLADEKTALQKMRQQASYLESNRATLEREIKDLAEKLDLLAGQEGTACPLCETELEAAGIEIIRAKYHQEQAEKQAALNDGKAQLQQLTAELTQRERDLNQREAKITVERNSLQARAGGLEQEVNRVQAAAEGLDGLRDELTATEERLARRDFAPAEQQQLAGLESEIKALAYDGATHDALRQSLEELTPYEAQKQQLDEAGRLTDQEKTALARAEEAATELRASRAAEAQRRDYLDEELRRLPQLTEEFNQAQTAHRDLLARQQAAQEAVWNARTKLERLGELAEKKKEAAKMLAHAASEEQIYRDLALAFGKRGVQALLIESALPEIEIEANKLLARMTDNRMHLKIESQRETKAGTVRETLDIKISDEMGTRDYEMYSGGEAFRINFAIRIALSQFLARRAGAPLPTLVIDEGFGTQDNVGIEKIKEAINSIQDDFDKILVITHIEELRDAFPTRINVVKTADGSTFEVL